MMSKKEKDKQETEPEELSEQEKKLNELTDDLQRLQAEFENFKKRNEKENQDFKEYANASLISEFLPLLDSLNQAVQAIENAEELSKEQALEGTRKLQEQLTSLLAQKGLEEIKTEGEKFNPEVHDCLLQENCDGKKDGIVLEELQKGYLLKGRLLRPAKVKVNSTEGEKE
jgi:molecular chaperone GrpE